MCLFTKEKYANLCLFTKKYKQDANLYWFTKKYKQVRQSLLIYKKIQASTPICIDLQKNTSKYANLYWFTKKKYKQIRQSLLNYQKITSKYANLTDF